jgi:hypothetical protein
MHQQARGMQENLEQTIVAGDAEFTEDFILMLERELSTGLDSWVPCEDVFIFLSTRVIISPIPRLISPRMVMASPLQVFIIVTGGFSGAR